MHFKFIYIFLILFFSIQVSVAETTKKGTIEKKDIARNELTINGVIYKFKPESTKVKLNEHKINPAYLTTGQRVKYKIKHHVISEIEILSSDIFLKGRSSNHIFHLMAQ